MFHVDSFTCTITQKGRSPLVETPVSPSTHIDNGLLVLASAELGDENDVNQVKRGTAREVKNLATQVKASEIMLLPFAHLFAEPAPPQAALDLLEAVAAELREAGLSVQRPPFGWFHTWDLQAKGHPLSRVARTVRPVPQPDEQL
jgi:threonyl-tRNA synthetase